MDWPFLSSPWFAYLVLPLLIFLSRVVDVSMQTMRIIFVARGHRVLGPVLGFFEVTIWLLAIGQIMHNLTNPLCYLAYGAGFAMGSYTGMVMEERLATGMVALRIITQRKTTKLPQVLTDEGYGVTTSEGMGGAGPVTIMYVATPRKRLPDVVAMINRYNPKAFYSVEHIRLASGGNYPSGPAGILPGLLRRLRWRKGK